MTQPIISEGQSGLLVSGLLNNTLKRWYNVKDYGAVGNGSSNDYAAFAAALADIYTNKGGVLEVPYTTAGYVLGTSLVIDVGSYAGGDGITINLNGSKILPSHAGWCFDVLTNFFGANNGGLLGRKQITIEGGGANIITSNSAAAGGIRLNDAVGARISDLAVNGYAAGVAVQLFITTNDQSTWVEHCELNNIRGSGNLTGLYLKSSNINASFLGNVFRSVVFEGRVNNCKLFNIEGLLFDALFMNCGGYYNQASTTGGCGFYLNGGYCGTTFINPYIDGGGGGTQSPLTDIVFGPTYTNTTQYFPMLVNVIEISLPINWRSQLHVVGPTNITGVLSGITSANPREVLRATRTYYVNASTGSDTTKDGLSTGSPFATFAHAMDVIYQTIDCAGLDITIQLADATYTTPMLIKSVPVGLGGATFTVKGTTSGGAVISTIGAAAIQISSNANVLLSNITVQTTSSGDGISLDSAQLIIGTGVQIGACARWGIFGNNKSRIVQNGAMTFTGNSSVGIALAGNSGYIKNAAITNSGRTFSATFMDVAEHSTVGVNDTAFTHTSTTGSSFYCHAGGLIQTFGAATNLFTGTAGFAEAGQFALYL